MKGPAPFSGPAPITGPAPIPPRHNASPFARALGEAQRYREFARAGNMAGMQQARDAIVGLVGRQEWDERTAKGRLVLPAEIETAMADEG